jgi:rubrerythrin
MLGEIDREELVLSDPKSGADGAMSRRDFLKWATTAAAAALAAPAASLAAAASAGDTPKRRGKDDLKDSKTAANLMTAFAGESQARNRYTFFAARAREEGYMQMADIFEETADHELEHATRLFSFMAGSEQKIAASFPFGVVGETVDNLKAAAEGERYEWESMYPEFARVAREEGFDVVANVMINIAVAEKYHERRYLALRNDILGDAVFKKPAPVVWRCSKCGFLHEGTEAPRACPACGQHYSYFEVLAENY